MATGLISANSAGLGPLQAQERRRTPTQVLGPFYPVVKPLDQDADLTMIAGRPGRAAGQAVEVMGRVVTRFGTPVPGARIEIWQANSHGKYRHPSDRNPKPIDPNFEGFAVLTADAEGRYRFRTVKPGAYPDDAGTYRAPHIHFDVGGKVNRLLTQMYFAGEALNDTDRFLATAGTNRGRLIVDCRRLAAAPASSPLVAEWDIVLDEG